MRTWIRPMVVEENLVANARVAESVCYKLSCKVGDNIPAPGNYWNQSETPGVSHSPSGTPNTCADPNANRIITGNGGKFEGAQVGEYNGKQGWLPGAIDFHDDPNHNGKVDVGEIIYWHTTNTNANDGRIWNHWGEVQLTDANHPNHS